MRTMCDKKGTCTIPFIIPTNANIYVNGLNTCNNLKQW